MRFHVIWRKSHEPEEAYRDFFRDKRYLRGHGFRHAPGL